MLRKVIAACFMLFTYFAHGQQACTTLGQNPSTAFPVCGLDTFKQASVPTCGGKTIQVPGCNDGVTYGDLNPFWYRFTCYQSGTLGFTITPENINDDYDWQLFDITGRNPDDVYTDVSLFVVGNWSGTYGVTGTSANNTNTITCASNPPDLITPFSKMPDITIGHTYILLISHFSGSGQSGYNLFFSGGTASIVDSLKPALVSASANCSGQTITIAINKKVQCSSLASNGTDFIISHNLTKVLSASGINCGASFDMDSLTINIDKPLPPGDYFILIKKGSDQNTLLDNCNNDIPENDSIPFTIFPLTPTPMDSLTPVQCAPDILRLVFRKRMLCSSVATNGSDFKLSGNNSVAGAFADSCSADGLSNIIKVKLTKPIQTAGTLILTLQDGTDGNTLLDECAQETPAGSAINFITSDTVSASFNYKVGLGCVFDTLFYVHDGRNEVDAWNWIFDVNGTSGTEDSLFLFNDYGAKHIQLAVTNGVCTDSSSADILLDNQLISRFTVTPTQLCPEDAATFTDSSTGKIVSWNWTFGDGTTSILQNPALKYYPAPLTRTGSAFPAALIVKNNIGCYDTSQTMMKVFYNCYIAVPSAFTPNGDGLNDYLYPLNAYKADNLEFKVYNRWGQMVFETKDWTKKWDGRVNGNPQAAGTYVWMLHYTNRDTGQLFSLKGTTVLIR
ncbi:MAG: gliding motility-associated C-terminal domain-containing protein [Parafilimonas sp.]